MTSIWTRINESYSNVYIRRTILVIPFLIVGLLLSYGLRRLYRGTTTTTNNTPAPVKQETPVIDPTLAKSVFLAREAARHVADSIDTQNPLSSYFHAVNAHAMASTAKDISSNASSLNDTLGVDIHQFLEYTQRVVHQAETKLIK